MWPTMFLYRIGVSGLTMTQGPHEGKSANTFTNNIVAYARKAMFEEQNPWPENCTNTLKVKVTHNLFYFDLDDTSGFPRGEWLCRFLRYGIQPVPELPREPLLAD